MKNILKYKYLLGSVNYSSDDEILFGKIEGINDLVTFEGKSVMELKKAFKEAVDDYLAIYKEKGKPVFKSFKGSFNIRINPALHKKAAMKSTELGISLNQLVEEAMAAWLK